MVTTRRGGGAPAGRPGAGAARHLGVAAVARVVAVLRAGLAAALGGLALAAFLLGALLGVSPSQREMHRGSCQKQPERPGVLNEHPWSCGLQRVWPPAQQGALTDKGGLECFAYLQPGGWSWSNAGMVASDIIGAKEGDPGSRNKQRAEAFIIDALMDPHLTEAMLNAMGPYRLPTANGWMGGIGLKRREYHGVTPEEKGRSRVPASIMGVFFTHGDLDHTMGVAALPIMGGAHPRGKKAYSEMWKDKKTGLFPLMPYYASAAVVEGPFGKALASGKPPINAVAMEAAVTMSASIWRHLAQPGSGVLPPWLRTILRLMPSPLQQKALQGLGALKAFADFESFYFTSMMIPQNPKRRLSTPSKAVTVGTGGYIQPHAAPSHTAGDMVYVVPTCKTAYMGDVLMYGVTPIQWHGPASAFIEAFDKVLERELALEFFVPGHGPVVGREGVLVVQAYWVFVQKQGAECFRDGITSDICAARALQSLPAPFNDWDYPERLHLNLAVEIASLQKRDRVPEHERLVSALVDMGRRAVEESLANPPKSAWLRDIKQRSNGPAAALREKAALLEQMYWRKLITAKSTYSSDGGTDDEKEEGDSSDYSSEDENSIVVQDYSEDKEDGLNGGEGESDYSPGEDDHSEEENDGGPENTPAASSG